MIYDQIMVSANMCAEKRKQCWLSITDYAFLNDSIMRYKHFLKEIAACHLSRNDDDIVESLWCRLDTRYYCGERMGKTNKVRYRKANFPFVPWIKLRLLIVICNLHVSSSSCKCNFDVPLIQFETPYQVVRQRSKSIQQQVTLFNF